MPIKYLRTFAALILALAITCVIGLFLLIVAVPYNLALKLLRLHANPFELAIKFWARLITCLCLRGCMDIRIVVENTVEPAAAREQLICMANHPTSTALPALFWFLTKKVSSRTLVIAKKEMLRNPFVGWAAWAINSAIFINRADHEAAIAGIRKGMREHSCASGTIVIFPDGTRPRAKRIASERDRLVKMLGPRADHFQFTTVPRSGGLSVIMAGMTPATRIVNLTVAFDRAEEGVKDLPGLVGARLHIHAETLTRFIYQDANIKRWLLDEWERKNLRIAAWRTR